MANKVGAGYVDIEPQVDARDLKALKRKIETFLADTKANIQVDVKATELNKLRQKIKQYIEEKTFYLKVDVRATTLTALRKKIEEALTIRPIYIDIDVRARDIAATRAKIEAGLAGINVNVGTSGGGSGGGNGGGGGRPPRRPRLPNAPGGGGGGGRRNRRGSAAGRLFGFGSSAGGGVLGGIASAFQLNGPIGGAIIVTLAAALAAAAVPLGAMLGGLIFAAIGAVPLVGAILIGLQDPKVTQALTDFKNKFSNLVIKPLQGEFGTELKSLIDQFSAALDRWAPMIQSILRAGMSFAQPIANGAEGAIDILLPSFDNLINSKFMKALMAQLGKGLEVIAQSFSDAFGDILNDPEAQKGFVRGLADFFEAVGWLIGKIFDFLRFLGRTWESWNEKDVDGVSTVDRFKKLFDTLGKMNDIIKGHLFTKSNLDTVLEVITALFGFVVSVLENPMIQKLLNFATDFKGFDSIPGPGELSITVWQKYFEYVGAIWDKTVESLKTVWNDFTSWLSSSWETVKGWWNSFVEWLKTQWNNFTAWIKQQWTIFWAPFVTAWENIKAGWNALMAYLHQPWSTFVASIKQELTDFIAPFQVAWNKISAGWSSLVSSVTNIWNNFFNWLTGKANTVMAKVTKTPTTSSGGGNNTTTAGKRFGGLMRFAGGGMAVGAGSGISDSIPAMISNGEFVVNAKATQDNLGMLNAINNGASYQPNINVYIDGVAVAHRAVVSDALRSVTGYLTAGRSD